MKSNFNTAELLQTAGNIKNAVASGVITADMVGGLFSALVEAQGEVIEALGALEREVVTVKVNGYDGEQRVSAAGAKVYVDIFSIGSVPTVALPRQELTANEEGVVTFEVFKGYQYAVFSKIERLSASFQLTFEACQDTRSIELWNFPLGVYMLGYAIYYNEDDETMRNVAYISGRYVDAYEDPKAMWDAHDNESLEDAYFQAILVATEDTAFAIVSKRAEATLTWAANRYYGKLVPNLPAFGLISEDWEAAVELARNDFDGNLNTAKIQAFCKSAAAVDFCTDTDALYTEQRFLPSAGQLFLIYINRTAINTLISAANANGYEFESIDTNYYWSSSQYDEFCAWSVNMFSGSTDNYIKSSNNYVRAVSAFLKF